MNKRHEKFYKLIATLLTNELRNQSISIHDLSRIAKEQLGTIKGILAGRRFNAHHLLWIEKFLGKSIIEIYQGENGGNEKTSGGKDIQLSDFI